MIEIYGKKGCTHCQSAIRFCESKNLDYVYHDVEEEKITKEMLMEKSGIPGIKTVPQIWSNRLYLGDLNDLKKYVTNLKQLNG